MPKFGFLETELFAEVDTFSRVDPATDGKLEFQIKAHTSLKEAPQLDRADRNFTLCGRANFFL